MDYDVICNLTEPIMKESPRVYVRNALLARSIFDPEDKAAFFQLSLLNLY